MLGIGSMDQWTKCSRSKTANLFYKGQRLRHEANPVFLGIKFDRQLTFKDHISDIRKKMQRRIPVLRALSGKAWGCAAGDLRSVYVAYVRSCAEYGGAAWLPMAAPTNIDKLEVQQRAAARVITGCLKATPCEALEREANLMPLRLRGKEQPQLPPYVTSRAFLTTLSSLSCRTRSTQMQPAHVPPLISVGAPSDHVQLYLL
jgi:hypothetical protein